MANEILDHPIQELRAIEDALSERRDWDTSRRIRNVIHYLERLTKVSEPSLEMRCTDCGNPMDTYVGLDCCGTCYHKRIWGDQE